MTTYDGAPANGVLSLRSGMSIATLQSAVGLFQAVVGAMMLVAPHQFASLTYAALQPHLGLWGIALLAIGSTLLAVGVLRHPRPLEIAAHLLSGGAMLTIAYGFGQVGGWTGTTNFVVVGLGIASAPFVAGPRPEQPPHPVGNWLALVVGLGALLTGAVILGLPDQFSAPIYDVARAFLPLLGVAFFVAGLLLAAAHLRWGIPRPWFWAIHLLAGGTLLAFCLVSAIPLRAWMGMAYYGGFGTLIAILPWLEVRQRRIDPLSLRTRLAATMAVVAVVPLLLTVPLALDYQEQATTKLAISQQQLLATAVAQDVADYVAIHQTALAALAARSDLLDASPEAQHQALKGLNSVYPDLYVASTLDLSGNQIARSDDLPPRLSLKSPLLNEVNRLRRPVVVPQISATTHGPAFTIAAPVVGADGHLKGFVAAGLDAWRIEALLARTQSMPQANSFMVDANGRVIAHQNNLLVASSTDFSSQPAVATLLATQEDSGAIRYGQVGGQTLAGFATVPGLGWGVVIEEPLALVLAENRAQRDLAFAVMLIAGLVAAAIGFFMAERLIKPLRALVRAVGAIAGGVRQADLPDSSVSELHRLGDAIGQMTVQLASAEAERERLLAAEQVARAQAEAAVRARDEFISVAAHELKTPVTSLQGFAQLLIRQFEKSGTMDPERVARAMEQITRQSTRLSKLTDQLLNLSRLEAGKLILAPEKANLAAVIANVITATSHSRPNRTLEMHNGVALETYLDPLRMEQVFTNLIENAIKFSPEDTPVEIELDFDERGWIRAAVRDHGVGIPEERRGCLFQRFYQAHPEGHYGGMGIGLYVSHQIVELHGGSIQLEQPEGGGSRFVVRLPVSTEEG